MADTPYHPPSQQPQAVMSLEGIFISLYIRALDNLQATWMNPGGVDSDQFIFQIRFLMSIIPDKNKRKELDEIINKAMDKLKTDSLYVNQHTGVFFDVVSAVVEFLCSSFDLTHFDIVGPATSRQYRDAIIEIPEMPQATTPPASPPLPPTTKEETVTA